MTIREHDVPAGPVHPDRIRRIVRGDDPAISRRTGLYLLAVRSEAEDRVAALARILGDPHEPAALRRDAARYLGRIEAEASLAALERGIEIEDGLVRAAVLKSLGRIGRRESLERIEAVRARLEPPAAAAAQTAILFLAHRFGVEGRPVPLPPPAERLELDERDARDLQVGGHHGHHGSHVPDRTPPLGFDAAWDAAIPLRCGPREMVLLVDREVLAEPARLIRRPFLAGAIGHWHAQDGMWMPIFHFLTDPVEGRAQIAVTNASGKVVFGGDATVREGAASFAVRGIAEYGIPPVAIEGRVAHGRLDLTRARVGTRPARKRVTVPER